MPSLDRWERICLGLIVAGGALRLTMIGGRSLDADAAWYVTMGKTLFHQGEFIFPWEPGHPFTWHFPPLFPAFIGLFLVAFGSNMLAVKIASATAGILFIGVVFACTRSLYGRATAFAVTAVAATMPTLYGYDQYAMSETFVAMLFALTIWAILKSLDDARYIVLGGLFAGLGFLAKASMGPFFLLAGGAGFLWRFWYVRWKIFQDKWYLLGASVFAVLVLPWSIRNILRHGWPHWETQLDATEALTTLFATPAWPRVVVTALLWAALLLVLHALPFLPGLRSAWKDIRAERTSGLLLGVVTPLIVASFFIAGFSLVQNYDVLTSFHPMRYAITPVVPLLWLCMRGLDWESPAPSRTPTAGAHLPRREAAFVVAGGSIVALSLAMRYPWLYSQQLGDLVLLVLGVLVGMVVLAMSRSQAWAPATRTGVDGVTWRAVRRKAPRRVMLLSIPLFLGAFLLTEALLPLVLAAACACLVATWRYRAVVVALVFVGWALGGGAWGWPEEQVDAKIAQIAHAGDTVAVSAGVEPWLYPFLPDDVEIVPWTSNATFRIQENGMTPPENATFVETFDLGWDLQPGAMVRMSLSSGKAPERWHGAGGKFDLYRANATL